ncbi:hypothetical protein AVEN_206939-1 [Araneus ventricosus]|uniref:EB domain-containing protein n=1 Tax=Araneus ventricosus TaxID=182803 RepID=A0A4Y2PS26_ARAVE|nr:hypothetical protein AVEN_206939-1 [Araneus ventricosus]
MCPTLSRYSLPQFLKSDLYLWFQALYAIPGVKDCPYQSCPDGSFCVFKSTGYVGCHHPAAEGQECSRGAIEGLYIEYPPCMKNATCSGGIVVGKCRSSS